MDFNDVPCLLVNCSQLAQLEVAIREHKQEMVRKVESLQQSLEAKDRELREVRQELTDKKLKVRRCHIHPTGCHLGAPLFIGS